MTKTIAIIICITIPLGYILYLAYLSIRLSFELKKEISKEQRDKELIPDSPIGFGYKNEWIAVKTQNANEVADLLNLKARKCNWSEGVSSGKVFITPPIEGWVLVLGTELSVFEEEKNLIILKKLSLKFDECQAFLTNRIVDYHSWALVKKGELIRAVRYFLEDEVPFFIIGEPTKIEQNLKFEFPSIDEVEDESYWEKDDVYFIDEDTVMMIAENWSINPTTLDKRKGIESFGLLCT